MTTEPAPVDPYHYGWRYIRREAADGAVTFDQVPLTLENVLYPEVGDFIVHTKAHEDICHYLADILKMQVRHDPSAVVLHDVRVAWGIPEMRPNGPDIALIYGVQEHKNWSTFDCGEEGVRPIVVIEVTSPETRSHDLLEKVEIYEQAGVEHYIIIDSRAWKGREQFYLHSYQLGPTGYRLGSMDDLGRVRIGALDVWLGIEETHISCYNAGGERIGDYVAVEVARVAAEVARAAAEKDRRAARVEQAQAEARAQVAAVAQAEAEASAQTELAARAQAEARAQVAAAAQAEAEVRANAFEARLRDLEAELHRLRGALGDMSSP
jgi:Uma2 family endonuclease